MKSIEEIQAAVATLFNIPISELKGNGKRRAVALPRQIAIYVAKQLTSSSLPEIGRQFGGKRQAAVLYSIARIEDLMRNDKATEVVVKRLLASLDGTA